jgi:hypothetical protein
MPQNDKGNVVPIDNYRQQSEGVATSSALKSGGGGGTFDDMEARVKRLEDDMSELKSHVKAMRADLSYIRGKLDAMPSTTQLILFAVAVFVAAGIARFFGH